jgi:hypothetical protein
MPEAMYSHEEADALEAFILSRLQSSPGVRVARPFPPEERFLIRPFFWHGRH